MRTVLLIVAELDAVAFGIVRTESAERVARDVRVVVANGERGSERSYGREL